MQRKSSARQRAVTEPQQGALVAPGARAARELKMPAAALPPQSGSGEMTLGGFADRGITLANLYDTGVLERLRLDVRMRLISDLTQSLAWLHANPRLMSSHRHLLIAPSTIVLGLDGVARVDVRAAKKQTSDRSDRETEYCAPEVHNGDPAADHRADIFSVGVLAWEAIAGKRLTPVEAGSAASGLESEGSADYADGLPPALGAGGSDRENSLRKSPASRSVTKPGPSRTKTAPSLSLAEDAEWVMPFAELALAAMSSDVSQRPQDCRTLLAQLELIDPAKLATNQEIAEVVQGISSVTTLCMPEPTLPAIDALCQATDAGGLQFNDKEPCSSSDVDRCVQRQVAAPRRVPEPPPSSVALGASAPAAAPRATLAPKGSGSRKLVANHSVRAWFVAGLVLLAVLSLFAGFVVSVLSR